MYKQTNQGTVLRLSDGASIPEDWGNTDYQAYQLWLSAGNTPLPADEPDPKEVARAALLALEQATQMNRLSREFMLVSMQDLAQRQSVLLAAAGQTVTPEDILNASPGWRGLVEVNGQALALRRAMV